MDKIVILHNVNDKNSRDFVASEGSGKQIIDWYADEKSDLHLEYLNKVLPTPTIFPCVVDTELSLVSNNPATVQAATDAFTSEEASKLVVKERRARDSLLKGSDVYMLSDFPKGEVAQQDIEDYRQDLRDVPAQQDFPTTITWPTDPIVGA